MRRSRTAGARPWGRSIPGVGILLPAVGAGDLPDPPGGGQEEKDIEKDPQPALEPKPLPRHGQEEGPLETGRPHPSYSAAAALERDFFLSKAAFSSASLSLRSR